MEEKRNRESSFSDYYGLTEKAVEGTESSSMA